MIPMHYTMCCKYAALSAARMGRAQEAQSILKVLTKIRSKAKAPIEEDRQDLYLLLAADNSELMQKIISERKYGALTTMRLWALASSAYPNSINLKNRAIAPEQLKIPPLLQTRDQRGVYRVNREIFITHSLIDAYALMKAAKNDNDRKYACWVLNLAVKDFLAFTKNGPGIELPTDVQLFQFLWLKFQETKQTLSKTEPHIAMIEETESLFRKLLEDRKLLATGSSKLLEHETFIPNAEWNRLWNTYLKSESNFLDIITPEEQIREVKRHGKWRLD